MPQPTRTLRVRLPVRRRRPPRRPPPAPVLPQPAPARLPQTPLRLPKSDPHSLTRMNPQAEPSNPGLAEVVFEANDSPVFAVLDGASVPKLIESLYEHKPEHCCLYPGELKPDMATVAPYLVRLEAGKEFTDLVLRKGW